MIHVDTLASMNSLADLYYRIEQYDKALPLFDECLAKRRQVLGDDHEDTVAVMFSLSCCYMTMSQDDKALPLLDEYLEKSR